MLIKIKYDNSMFNKVALPLTIKMYGRFAGQRTLEALNEASDWFDSKSGANQPRWQ